MRVLITGYGGFVAPYVARALRNLLGSSLEILGTHHRPSVGEDEVQIVDVNDVSAVDRVIAGFRPDHVIHLAAVSQIPDAAADVDRAWRTNVLGTLNCARAVLHFAENASFIFASSGQVYGHSDRAHTEDSPIAPINDYASTKAAADIALGALAMRGLRIVRLRLYNHTGPRQAEKFVVSNFAAQIARIEHQRQEAILRVGDLGAERDFLDVRDVADAYARTVQRAEEIPTGTILNICSGQPVKIRALLDKLVALAREPITIEIDPARWRKLDLAASYGDPARCRRVLDWEPRYSLQQTLADILDYHRKSVT
ncbi:GDP-mannose 4,6-dehydratase [Mesorhizobium sp. ES1-1]|uniref:GDP-mannose 4,6-dehydratase n=1 Tax=Mesorhizobium sp. ES1-1 TaxID=2876629 RepID=UPI001CCF7BC5|nr:GDP-mannose 4,6-dehydratase [Mesorhizobium sp. ES1-1]MBZ9678187.1 GDP-mannose 4,6-dehydratase [Mesorhizobium sp. ES1-1]